MKEYFISVLAASLIAALIGILTPDGEKNGTSKLLKFLTSLFLICVLVAPLTDLVCSLQKLADGEINLPDIEEELKPNYEQQRDEALSSASKTYFTQALTQMLEQEFSIASGEIRCIVVWEQTDNGEERPARITLVLSGKAVWKDPKQMEAFVTELLGCECISAIE